MSTSGIPQLQRRLTAVGNVGTAILRSWQTAATAYSKVYAPKRSGHLKQTIHPGALTETRATVETSAAYAAPQEFGSRPHEIRPVRAKVLAWGGARRLTGTLRSGSSAEHFAMVVHHPGNPATHFMERGAARAFDEVVKQHGDAIIKTAWNNGA